VTVVDKVDLKKTLRGLYTAPTADPELIDVPALRFLMADGAGDPRGNSDYGDVVEALYGVAYSLKFLSKAAGTDFVVMPLQGLWWADDMVAFLDGSRDDWRWTMMILQPESIDDALLEESIARVAARKTTPALGRIRLERYEEGKAAQIMHRGPYAAERPTIERLHHFIADRGLKRSGHHHEIYLSDPRRSAPERMKTIIRQPVAQG
jgi:hypothetical protein